MGGHALKTVKTVRKPTAEYERIKGEIIAKIDGLITYEFIKNISEKTDHGDLDILVVGTVPETKQFIKDTFAPHEIVVSGSVVSFDYTDFQIDMIICHTKKEMTMAQFFFSYGDTGALIGIILATQKIKFGHNGLFTKEDMGGEVCVLMTDVPVEICEFVGLDFAVWSEGFKTFHEIYSWISGWKHFNIDLFKGLNRNYAKGRKMFQGFFTFLGLDPKVAEKAPFIKGDLRKEAREYFHKGEEVEVLHEKFARKERERLVRNDKFSGEMVVAKGITGKDTAKVIFEFKHSVVKAMTPVEDRFNEWLDEHTIEEVHTIFNAWFAARTVAI